MKTRVLYFTMIAAALTFSCQKAELENNGADNNGTNNEAVDFVPGPGRILAVSPTGPDSKIGFGNAVEGKYPVVWTNNDEIKVYSENSAEGVAYTYTTDATEGVSSAVFTGEPVEGETRYAVFPSSQAKSMSDGKIQVSFLNLNSKQSFQNSLSANSENLAYMPMWAKESDEGVFQFNSLCGAVAFKFNDYQELRGMKITNVTITSEKSSIAGVGTINPETGELTVSGTLASQKKISVDYTDGLAIGQSSSPSIDKDGIPGFIIALPAMTYPAGDLTVTITDNFGRVFKRVVTKELTITPGQVRNFPTLSFTFAYGEANSVVVEPGNTVSFDASMRYSFEKSLSVDSMTKAEYSAENAYFEKDGVSVAVLWEIAESDTSKDVDGAVVTSATLKDDEIEVVANGAGNALVVLKDAEGVILWSWHIWVVNNLTDQTYTNCPDTPIFHNMNLGATQNKMNNHNTIGLYYQYGRKDPFVISKDFTYATSSPYRSEGTEKTSTYYRTTGGESMSWTIKNPDKRIVYNGDQTVTSEIPSVTVLFNWLQPDSPQENWGNTADVPKNLSTLKALKGGYKTIYDPCPSGYRVPDMYYFSGLDAISADKVTEENISTSKGAVLTDIGCLYAIAGSGLPEGYSTLTEIPEGYAFYPNPGFLNQGKLNETPGDVLLYNKRGYYWTINNFSSGSVMFQMGNSGVWGDTYSKHKAAMGSANNIRCMKIQTVSAE